MSNAFSTPTLEAIREQVDGTCIALKSYAQARLAELQAGSVDANWIFRLVDTIAAANGNITAQANALGAANFAAMNAYITAQKPGYPGTYTTDVGAVMTAAAAVISWIVTNFPAASGFIQCYTLNADGARTAASFTSAATAGLQAALSSLIATIT